MKEYIFDRTTGEFIREQETHLDPLESKKQGKNVYLISAIGTTTPPPEQKDGYAVIWNGTVWERIEDHRGIIVWKSHDESMKIRELGAIPDGWSTEQPEKPVEMADYDAAMEAHIAAARVSRGYTTREPTEYLGSSVPRWAQDAEDYIAFRDKVMLYGLEVINGYAATGKAPSLEVFKAGLEMIKCEWSYNDGN
ncbi:MAG: hypothetical protein J6T08_09015 [Lentisphaeria bacterium]|nr:hypothetical protein [Lentisphaeria bacterium]